MLNAKGSCNIFCHSSNKIIICRKIDKRQGKKKKIIIIIIKKNDDERLFNSAA